MSLKLVWATKRAYSWEEFGDEADYLQVHRYNLLMLFQVQLLFWCASGLPLCSAKVMVLS